MEKIDHDSKTALRARCSACGRAVAQHPFCAICGNPQLCVIAGREQDSCGGCAAEQRSTKPTGLT